MQEQKQCLPELEEIADELVALMIARCERCFARSNGASQKQKAMAACLIAVRESIKSFLAVAQLPE